MGIYGSVRCLCYENGQASPPPVPVWVDAHDQLQPVNDVDRAALWDWQRTACTHPEMAEAELKMGWRRVRGFYATLEEAGPDIYPVLLTNLPQWNGAWSMTPGEAASALDELDRFEAASPTARSPAIEQVIKLCEASIRTGHHVDWG